MVRAKLPGSSPLQRVATWLETPIDETSGRPTSQRRRVAAEYRLLLDLRLHNRIGTGASGIVWTARDARSKWLIVKEVAVQSKKQQDGFSYEVHMHRLFQQAGVGVALRAAWLAHTQGTTGVIVMDPVDTTLRHLVHTFQNDEGVLLLLARKLRRLVDQLHDQGLVHGDLHLDNVGAHMDASRRHLDLKLLDFARSLKLSRCCRNHRQELAEADVFWVWRFVRLHCQCFEAALRGAGFPIPVTPLTPERIRLQTDHLQWAQDCCIKNHSAAPLRVKRMSD